MDPTITSDEKVQVRFTIKDVDGTEFTDALYFTPAERAAVTPVQLAAMQMERFAKWKAAAAPIIPMAATEEQIRADLDALEQQRAALEEQITTRSAELDAVTAGTALLAVSAKGG